MLRHPKLSSRLAIRGLVCAILVCGWAVTAQADKLLFSGEHGVRFSNFGGFEATAIGTGVATTNSGTTLDTLQLTQDFAVIDETITVTGPDATAVPEIRLENIRIRPGVQGGLFGPIAGALGTTLSLTQNTLPVGGTIKLCQVAGCASAHLTQPLTQTTGSGVSGVGVGGTQIGTSPDYTVIANPWTVNTTTLMHQTPNGGTSTLTAMGFASGPLSMTGSTLPSGMVQLVTATRVLSTALPGNNAASGQIHRLTINFQPEPRSLLLLGAGAVTVFFVGYGRRRRLR